MLQVGLLNVDGYYNSLLSFIDKAVEEGFISPSARHIIVSSPSAKDLVKKMEVSDSSSSLSLSPMNKGLVLLLSSSLFIRRNLFQEYFPRHERVASKLNWETEQLGHSPKYDISR